MNWKPVYAYLRPLGIDVGRGFVSCFWCRGEGVWYLHDQNHGGSMGLREGYCMAMYLRRNHVAFAASLERGSSTEALRQLDEYISRAEELWSHVDLSWLASAYARRDHLRAINQAPEHGAIADSVQEALL